MWKLECTWSASHASVLHSHLRHLKPFIHAIIEGRTQTRVHDLSLAVNKNENCFPQEALCYLDSGSGESVQFPRVYLVRGDAVKETCQHDQPHCSTLIRFGWWKADVAALSGTDACRCLEAGLRASWIWGEASEAERWCHGCHVRTSCHVKYCFQRGVERPFIGYLPRTPSRPWLIQHFWNAVVGLLYKEAAAFHKTQTNFNMLRFAFILSERL